MQSAMRFGLLLVMSVWLCSVSGLASTGPSELPNPSEPSKSEPSKKTPGKSLEARVEARGGYNADPLSINCHIEYWSAEQSGNCISFFAIVNCGTFFAPEISICSASFCFGNPGSVTLICS